MLFVRHKGLVRVDLLDRDHGTWGDLVQPDEDPVLEEHVDHDGDLHRNRRQQ